MSDGLLKVKQVAEQLGIDERTVRRYMHAGWLPYVRIGMTTIRFEQAEVDRLIQRGRRRGKSRA